MPERSLGKVFVTGGDGFIGSHLVERLVTLGHEVTALCIYNSQGSHGWLSHLTAAPPKNLKLILGDIRDRGFVESAVAGHDTVFHLAALIAIPYSYEAPQSYVDTNVSGTLNVASACLKAKAQRLVHTSTSEVYGTAQVVPITEHHPLQGQSPYSASKIGADMLVESFHRSFGLPAVTLRPFNTYGPRQSLRAIIPSVISQLLAGNERLRIGNVEPTRDFNFVDDTVSAFLAVGSADAAVLGQVFNAGSGREISIGDFVTLAAKTLGKKVSLEVETARTRPAASEVERLLADATRLTQATGWRPRTTLEEGIHRTAEWIRSSDYLAKSKSYHR